MRNQDNLTAKAILAYRRHASIRLATRLTLAAGLPAHAGEGSCPASLPVHGLLRRRAEAGAESRHGPGRNAHPRPDIDVRSRSSGRRAMPRYRHRQGRVVHPCRHPGQG